MRNSVLFVNPDYHCSFIYRDELRRLGWRANVYVPEGYPEALLYSNNDILSMPNDLGYTYTGSRTDLFKKAWCSTKKLGWLLKNLISHKYLIFYGGLEAFPLLFGNKAHDDPQVLATLRLARKLGNKIIQVPSGCLEEETRENYSKFDGGNVCGNCGWGAEVCNDEKNVARFNLVRKNANMVVGQGSLQSTQFNDLQRHIKYKSLDLELWRPNLTIPSEHLLPETKNIRILHSFYDKNRSKDGKNIKGSPHIIKAIKQLEDEGHPVEHMYLRNKKLKDMRYYQAQADLVVEQLIYGWWGSTGVETMSLGKPVICYLRPSAKELFFQKFPEYKTLPIIEANIGNIYQVLKQLITDKRLMQEKSEESRVFSLKHFDVKKNAKELIAILRKL